MKKRLKFVEGIAKTDDGVCLMSAKHPDDFPWHFIHKLVNVAKRKAKSEMGI